MLQSKSAVRLEPGEFETEATCLCNRSLQEGFLPPSQTHAVIRPLLKSDELDASDVKNYRPVSNLTFMSKLIERLVYQPLTVFRKHHSTETALIKVMSDISMAADKGNVTLLGLLDMSAAFDTTMTSCSDNSSLYMVCGDRYLAGYGHFSISEPNKCHSTIKHRLWS